MGGSSRCTRTIAGALLGAALVACGGGGHNTATGSGAPNGSVQGNTGQPGAPSAPLGTLTVQSVADFANRSIDYAFTDGTAIVAASTVPDNDGRGQLESLIRLDTSGTIVSEVPLGSSNVYQFVKTTAGEFAMGYFMSDDPSAYGECGFRKVDPATLALGPTIKITQDGSCTGGGGEEEVVDGTVIWTADYTNNALIRIDTSSGAIAPVAINVPSGYEFQSSATVIGHDAFVELGARFDQQTGKKVTDANGNPLPQQLAKVDGSTSQVTLKEMPGSIQFSGGRVFAFSASNSGSTQQVFEVNPATLEVTEIQQSDFPFGTSEISTGNGVSWSVERTGDNKMRVTQRDPANGNRATAEGEVTPGLTNTNALIQIPIGTDLYVVLSSQNYDQTTQTTTMASKLFKVAKV